MDADVSRHREDLIMRKRLITAAATAVALIAAPVAAQSALGQSSVGQRAPAAIDESEGFAPVVLLAVVAAAAVVTGVVIVTQDDEPTSP